MVAPRKATNATVSFILDFEGGRRNLLRSGSEFVRVDVSDCWKDFP